MVVPVLSYTLLWLVTLKTVALAFSYGHDLSSVAQMENNEGATWLTTSGDQTTIEDILGNGGMDSVRLRYMESQSFNPSD